MGETDMVFAVRARRDVHLLLAAMPGTDSTLAYEVHLGMNSNQESLITRKDGSLRLVLETPDILDPDEFRCFWMSWMVTTKTVLQLGVGCVIGDNVLETVVDKEEAVFPINAYSITTGLGIDGEWHFAEGQASLSSILVSQYNNF